MKTLLLSVSLCLCVLTSCKPDPVDPLPDPEPSTGRVFILNEGNFQWGNASLDLYDPETNVLVSGIFESVNQNPLGDVLQSMSIHEGKAYLVVNNSNKIEVVDPDSLISLGTIEGFTSPRFFLGISPNKAYVSDLYANEIAIVDVETQEISGQIPLPGWSEQMILLGEFAFVCNVRRPYLYVIHTQTDAVVDSIKIGLGGNRLVRVDGGNIWVACGETLQADAEGALYIINPNSRAVVDSFLFPLEQKPSELQVNAAGTHIYFLNGGVHRMAIDATALPATPIIPEDGGLFYGLGIDPAKEEVYVADAIDFVQRGAVLRYDSEGNLLHEFRAGIIPGRFYFAGE